MPISAVFELCCRANLLYGKSGPWCESDFTVAKKITFGIFDIKNKWEISLVDKVMQCINFH